jgi:hypothetical protein
MVGEKKNRSVKPLGLSALAIFIETSLSSTDLPTEAVEQTFSKCRGVAGGTGSSG